MLFSSLSFLFFYLPAVLAGNILLPLRARLPFLFAASLLFYGWGEPGTVILMAVSILANYALTLAMASCPRRKKALLALSIGLQLAILGYFKYAGLIDRPGLSGGAAGGHLLLYLSGHRLHH